MRSSALASALVLVVVVVGCAARKSVPREPAAVATREGPEPAARDDDDPMREYGHVFHEWEELPDGVRAQVPASAFSDHIVVRIDVLLGCIARDPAKRPRRGYYFPEMAQRCIDGITQTHPVVTLTNSARMAISTWAPYDPDNISVRLPQIGVSIDDDEIGIALAPVVGPCDGIWLADTHWLLLPKRPVSLGLLMGGGVCEHDSEEE